MSTALDRVAALTRDVQAMMPKEAAVGSLSKAMSQAAGDIAEEVAKYISSKFSKAFTKFSKAYDAGHRARGVSAEINNQIEPGRKGDIIIEIKYSDRNPTVRVFAKFPKAKEYNRELAFDWDDSPKAVSTRIGAAVIRDLEYWVTAVAKAYET